LSFVISVAHQKLPHGKVACLAAIYISCFLKKGSLLMKAPSWVVEHWLQEEGKLHLLEGVDMLLRE
jgi:hypothetical protein